MSIQQVPAQAITRASPVFVDNPLQPRFDADAINAAKKQGMFWLYEIPERKHTPQYLVDQYIPYSADSRVRDAWLYQVAKANPIVWGMITSMVMRDKNRAWSLVGPYSTVQATKDVFFMAERGLGWREHVSRLSTAYYCTDIGAIIHAHRKETGTEIPETGRVDPQPITALFSFDPTRCRLTSDFRTPIEYFPPTRKVRPLKYSMVDALRFGSMTDVREEMNGLGHCFVSRVLDTIRLLVYAFHHYDELMSGRIPAGFVTVNGISQEQAETAMQGYDAMLDALKSRHFGQVAMMANEGGVPVDIKFTPVSQLPANFNLRDFLDVQLMTLALNVGYPVSEYWQTSSGQGFGREGENRESYNRAGGKGRNDFALSHQEKMQRPGVLSKRVHFEYDPKDDAEKLVRAQVVNSWMDALKKAKELGVAPEQLLRWGVEESVLPPYTTSEVEDALATNGGRTQGALEDDNYNEGSDQSSTQQARSLAALVNVAERMQDTPSFRAAIEEGRADNHPIVGYYQVTRDGWTYDTQCVLWDSPKDFLKGKPIVKRIRDQINN